jgi:iron complex transport system permease protein
VAVAAVLGVALVVTLAVSLMVGAVPVPARSTLGIVLDAVRLPAAVTARVAPAGWSDVDAAIILSLRLPRSILAALVGAGLALAGSAFQGLFANPMADPYIIGVSSGAALGAALGIVYGAPVDVLGLGGIPALAFGGALAAVALVYNLAKVGGRVPVTGLLLAGVAVSAFLSAVVAGLQVLNQDDLRQIVFWLLGSFSGRGWAHVAAVTPYIAAGAALLLFYARDLNLVLLGDEPARHLGANPEKLRRVILAAGALLTAASVAMVGIIGFVGLMVPHMVRLAVGPDHRRLLPASAIAGAILLTGADTLARSVIPPAEIPVGIITSLIGGPFFVYLLRRSRRPEV